MNTRTESPVSASTPRIDVATSRSRWLREPMLHFAIFGTLLFGIDQMLVAQRGDERLVVLNATADAELRKLYVDERGREPTEAEMASLRRRWFDNELLYREGLALGLDRGDVGIRERVIFKALNVVTANIGDPQPDEAELRTWFEQQRARYDEPARIDFLEAVVVGKPSLAEVEAFARVLDSQSDRASAPKVESGLRVYKGRPVATLEPAFGKAFTERLMTLEPGRWQALESKDGPRAVRVDARSERIPADFDTVRNAVQADWRDQRLAELRTEAVRALADKYRLEIAGDDGRAVQAVVTAPSVPGVQPQRKEIER